MPWIIYNHPKRNEHGIWHCSTCWREDCRDDGHRHVLMIFKGKPRPISVWEEVMKRPESPKEDAQATGLVNDEKFVKGYPKVHEFLTCTRWDDGGLRQPGTMTLFIESGVWKACLNDRENEMSMYATGETTAGCLKALEARLAGEQPADWRNWKKKKR